MKRIPAWIQPVVWLGFIFLGPPAIQADPLQSIANKMAKELSGLPSHKIAVMPFEYPDGGMSSGSTVVAERFLACLSGRRNIQIVERSLLPTILKEMKLEASGVTAASTAQKWGDILSVDALIAGTLVDTGNHRTEVHARLIQVDTGLILSAGSAVIDRTWMDFPTAPTRAPVVVAPADAASTATLPDIDQLIRNPVLPPHVLSTFRDIYLSSPDPRVRAGALYAMGIILERQGLPAEAAQAYRRLMDEYPANSRLRTDAAGRLWATTGQRP